MLLNNILGLQDGKYRIVRVLGQGGFGITYLAEHTMLDKLVAIKEFFPKEYCEREESTSRVYVATKSSSEIVEMLKGKFIKEAKNISKLKHPNIVTVYDIFQENETAYYVMEYVEGQSLADLVKGQGALNEEIALSYIQKIAKAVGYMHSLSMNHLDIKPANIMLRQTDGEPILIDFGLSKQYDASGGQTSTTPVGLSHGYAPAEQYRPGGVATFSPQTDIYALGATLFFMLSGNVPPHYSEIIEDGVPQLPTNLSSQTFEAIEKSMEIKKSKRPASVEVFLHLLPSANKKTFKEESSEQPIEPSINGFNKNSSNENDYHSTAGVEINRVHISDKEALNSIDATSSNNSPRNEDTASKEETTILVAAKKDANHSQKESVEQWKYIDLGLSVKWGTENIGVAEPKDLEQSYNIKLDDGNELSLVNFLDQKNKLPTISHFEELLEKCSWTLIRDNEGKRYKVTGPNGNSITFPISDLQNYILMESAEPDSMGFVYMFHIDSTGHHLYKTPPQLALIRPIKNL